MIYNGEHSLTFIDNETKNTWTDWHLIPTSKPSFNPPNVKTHYVDIPGSDGVIDLTEVVAGYPKYANREGSLEFIIANDYEPWNVLYEKIKAFLHGKEMEVILEDDSDYKYHGRFSINEFSSQKDNSKIVINYSLYPFRFASTDSITPWKWDPFNFYDGVITYNQSYIFDGSQESYTVSCPFSGKDTCPIFKVSNSLNLKLIYKNSTYELHDGDNYMPFVFLEGNKTEFKFTGKGEVQIIYTIRRL